MTLSDEMFVTALLDPEVTREFDRLCGTNVSRVGNALDLAIDDACGRLKLDLQKFREFTDDLCARMP